VGTSLSQCGVALDNREVLASSHHASNEQQSRLRDEVCLLFCAHGVAEAPTPLDDNNTEPWDDKPHVSRYGNEPLAEPWEERLMQSRLIWPRIMLEACHPSRHSLLSGIGCIL
jgi:hypothetical protein